MPKCLERCLANCLCMSFQICHDTCQLCSSNKDLSSEAMQQTQGCTHYNFKEQEEVGNQQCTGRSCTRVINCCMTSHPCVNNGRCLPETLPNSKKRFRCKCPDGYTGEQCEVMLCKPGYTGERCDQCKPGYTGEQCDHPIRSCRGYSNGSRIPGKYTVLKANNNPSLVFCDFDKNSSMTWTLIQSYSLGNNHLFNKSLKKNYFINKNKPSWLKYRLSKRRMISIQEDSTKWRVTCRYETDGVVYRDYLRASNTQLNILTYNKGECVMLEYINVRGHDCHNCTAYMKQDNNHILHFFPKKSVKKCEFKNVAGSCIEGTHQKVDEANFGYYKCKNTQHRCSSSNEATTQTWFGGH